MKSALITGITGQDGSYLTELLLQKNYLVFGVIRRSSSFNTDRLNLFFNHKNLFLRYGDMVDINSLINIVNEIKEKNPETIEIYNLAAQSHVKVSFEIPNYTTSVDGLGTLNILETIRQCNIVNIAKFYQASTSELYGNVSTDYQHENTPFNPQSPYACAKLYSYWITKIYRDSYNIYACNGILFNHESERRGGTFVTKKITKTVADIHKGIKDILILGNLDASRDWGHAKDYVLAMWKMLQLEHPQDLVISSNETHTVREFVELSFKHIDIEIKWRGEGLNEEGYNTKNDKTLVKINTKYYRPLEVPFLRGDSSKARELLDWKPEISFIELVNVMMKHDLEN
jgi:GDPmannose 4,6-dehydratase